MKIIKYGLYSALLYLVIMRPHFAVFSPVPHKSALPHFVKAHLGSNAGQKLQGVDISHFQGKVNFRTLAAGHIDFVYLKATEGTGYVDPTYESHSKALAETSLLHGAYHFFEPDKDAIKQAQHFIAQVKNTKHTLPPMLDVEITQGVKPEVIRQAVKKWLDHVQQALKCRPVLYSYGSFWSENLGENFNQYSFWLADYAKKPTLPTGLKNWRIWQYTDKGRMPGVENSVDRDVIVAGELNCYV